jgi:hypothetical protein
MGAIIRTGEDAVNAIILAVVLAAAGPVLPGVGTAADQAGTLGIRTRSDDAVTGTYAISVKSYHDLDKSLDGYKTFGFDYASKDDPLLEKELFKALQVELEAKGLERQDADPQMVIRLIFVVKPATESTWVRYLQLNFLDGAELSSGKELKLPPVVWKAEAASAGSGSDIRTVAPLMFREVLGEFPVKTAKREQRQVTCMEHGEIGIEVDRGDWRVIKAVQPGSPAAIAGVQVGDSLEKINDATMSWRMAYRPENGKRRWERVNWVEKNFLYIRWPSKLGNVMVLKLKSADKKTRTVKVPLVIKEECGSGG